MTGHRLIGASVRRREDPRLVTGSGTFLDDLTLPGTLHVAFLRSPHSHARLRRIEPRPARAHPAVLDVVTGGEIAERVGLLPVAPQVPGLKIPKHHSLAVEKVRYVGEPIAAVVARDPYDARDAVALIEVDYEALPSVVDPERALEGSDGVVHEELGDNVAFRWTRAGGDWEGAAAGADLMVRQRIVNQRLAAVAMEPRGVVAQWVAGNLTVWSSTQIPHHLRTQLAVLLGLPENRVRVIAPEVGGGFGSKANVYGEEAVIGYLAMKLGRPVKWTEDRRENLLATTHGRDQIANVEVAAKRDGTVLGLKLRIIGDLGAYHQLVTPVMPIMTGRMITGCYRIPNVQVEVCGVFTNKMSTDAYRGAGRPEATYIIERVMDLVAAGLGLDPVDVRLRNAIPPEAFPYRTATGLVYDSGRYEAALRKALEAVDYDRFRNEQQRLREEGRYVGIGCSLYVEICGHGPSRAMFAGGWESATVRIDPSGKVTVLTGCSPQGQGHETAFAQIAADELGLALDDVVVLHGDTAVVPYGVGTYGSRGIAVGGGALVRSLAKVREKAAKIASHLLETSVEDLVFEAGRFFVKGSPQRFVTFADVARAAYLARKLPPDTEPGLEATSFFEPSGFVFPFGAHICCVEVERETGEVRVTRYVAVDDCGRVINPMLVDGQIQGGITQGLGQALSEQIVYDELGQLLTGTLMEYAMLRAADVPVFEMDRTETPSPVNSLGAKGVGEAGAVAAPPALVNAVVDALAPLGVRHLDMPLTTGKIWAVVSSRASRANTRAT